MLVPVLLGQCPRCHKGSIFEKPVSSYPNILKTHVNCPVCGLRYEKEPGFFQGAMYVSYALSVGIFLGCGLAVYWLGGNPPAWVYILTTVIATFILAPLNFRYSRILMLHIFGGYTYDPQYSNKA